MHDFTIYLEYGKQCTEIQEWLNAHEDDSHGEGIYVVRYESRDCASICQVTFSGKLFSACLIEDKLLIGGMLKNVLHMSAWRMKHFFDQAGQLFVLHAEDGENFLLALALDACMTQICFLHEENVDAENAPA